MQVALVTVGDELLSGDTENTNATWLARQLTGRGATVTRVIVLPDDEELIARYVRRWSEAFDAVVTTGGLGGTHDDVTMEAVAAAFDRELAVDGTAREDVNERMATLREQRPELFERYNLRVDADAQASIPEGARPLLNPDGLSPGCVCENVYVFPGIPDEMHAMFELVADEFGGDAVSETIYVHTPEGAMAQDLSAVRDRFDVAVGSYPSKGGDGFNRVKFVGTDPDAVAAAIAWVRERVDEVDPAEVADRTGGHVGDDEPDGGDGR
jgi:molybdenum cofactor synthesis domain-containing protein